MPCRARVFAERRNGGRGGALLSQLMKTDELFSAIRQNDAAAVAALLDEDPALLRATSHDMTPILFAIYYGHPELAPLFVERGAQCSFGEAAALGERDLVLHMLDRDPSLLDSFTADGFPAVGLAIFFRHPELARDLIERGANVNAAARNAQKVMPVHAAVAVSDRETMCLLLDRGADINACQQMGYTALHEAAGIGDEAMVDLLLERGADPAAKDDEGKTPADIAAEKDHVALAEKLRRR